MKLNYVIHFKLKKVPIVQNAIGRYQILIEKTRKKQ